MRNLTINEFWKTRLPIARVASANLVKGWAFQDTGSESFEEAPLALSSENVSENDPYDSSILLVSAAGAVGKSTLARQIAFETGAVYVDLAKADPVGGNTLSGGLVKSNLFAEWQAQTTALLVDGLDEARLRVTQEAFEAFLADVAALSLNRHVPTVLFGRTGAVQDAWIALAENSQDVPVLEIGYFDSDAALRFAVARLQAAQPNSAHPETARRALGLILERLRAQTHSDGDRFAGYAPVLQAVADRVQRETNPSALISQIETGTQPVTLQDIVFAILERERSKLAGLPFKDRSLKDKLYSPEDQLDHLVARVYALPRPDVPAMDPEDAQTYSSALDTWVGEHPFLQGGTGTSSAVFDAYIGTHALRTPNSGELALLKELSKGAAANPFLSAFYLPENTDPGPLNIPSEHIGILYSSLRSRLSLGDSASLTVEGVEGGDDEESLVAEVEILISRRGIDRPRTLNFATEQVGTLRLGVHVEDVDIVAPHTHVEIGPGPEAVLFAPVSIQCADLTLKTESVVVENNENRDNSIVYLEAGKYNGSQMMSVPVLRRSTTLAVSWPSANIHPWTSFAVSPTPLADPKEDEALRRFRRFIISFRSHGRGGLARFKDKIEHSRMTKGTGQAVLNQMIAEDILTLSESMYFLDQDRLYELTGTSYGDCVARRFDSQAIEFVREALSPCK